MGSYSPDSKEGSVDEKHAVTVDVLTASPNDTHHVEFRKDQVDTGAQLVAGGAVQLDPEEATRIRKKIDWHILPLMCSKFYVRLDHMPLSLIPRISVLYWVQFMDKTTLGASAILGIRYV